MDWHSPEGSCDNSDDASGILSPAMAGCHVRGGARRWCSRGKRIPAERGDSGYVRARNIVRASLTPEQVATAETIVQQLTPRYGDKVALRRAKDRWAQVRSAMTGSRVGSMTSTMVSGVPKPGPATPNTKFAAGAVVATNGADATGGQNSDGSEAYQQLTEKGVPARVVSMPSMELFRRQSDEYRKSVLPDGVPRAAIEAAHPMSWYEWVGSNGTVIGLTRFGASSPYEKIYEELGITAEKLVAAALDLVSVSAIRS